MIFFSRTPQGERLLWEALKKLFDEWGLKSKERAEVLRTSQEVYQSWEMRGQIGSGGPWWQRAMKLFEVREVMSAVFESKNTSTMRQWLRTPNPYGRFAGCSPLEAMIFERQTDSSDLNNIIAYLKPVHTNARPPQ